MYRFLFWRAGSTSLYLLCQSRFGFAYEQKFSLVNVKLKWVKDKALDDVVAREKDLRAACHLVSIIASDPYCCLPIYQLNRERGQLGLPHDLKVSTFIRRYPTLFREYPVVVGEGCSSVPWFCLTDEALKLYQEELYILQQNEKNLIERLQKLLMLTRDRMLPLQTIDQLKWDMGLPNDYHDSLVSRYPQLFSLVRLVDDRIGLKLLQWDYRLAVSQLQNSAAAVAEDSKEQEDVQSLSFPIGFTRGFGLKRKCMQWLDEWQRLPYTSPYEYACHLDPRTDVSEKRIVGVFHELLHLTLQKKTERKNVSNIRKPLCLPQKFTKVFGRHPGIFYISQKCSTQTVILREAYCHQELLQKHPLVGIRERYADMMKTGLLNRSRGLYKKFIGHSQEEEDRQLQDSN
ncbi:protein WHAT'S THIS FACTOR 9, mitochondrial [Macadamia integrifolia]|uniref:protein WHAT'S THIS FACTOR 9, mitochondrial n=1 Tax=Macadamia integrifolia TaxID=60698 RepID=UPI001C4E477E|nr:protein WHAT'S THIS FACTOR 9, mitochondrial [Macadamia integrifolia]